MLVEADALLVCFMRTANRFLGGGDRLFDVNSRMLRHIEYPGSSVSPDLDEVRSLDIYASLGESLNWADSLDQRIASQWLFRENGVEWWKAVRCGPTVRAVRYARNSFHHDWAIAFDPQSVLSLRTVPRGVVKELTWVSDLPSRAPRYIDKHGEAAYRENLSGQSVIVTLAALTEAFAEALARQAAHARGVPFEAPTELLSMSGKQSLDHTKHLGKSRFGAYRAAWSPNRGRSPVGDR